MPLFGNRKIGNLCSRGARITIAPTEKSRLLRHLPGMKQIQMVPKQTKTTTTIASRQRRMRHMVVMFAPVAVKPSLCSFPLITSKMISAFMPRNSVGLTQDSFSFNGCRKTAIHPDFSRCFATTATKVNTETAVSALTRSGRCNDYPLGEYGQAAGSAQPFDASEGDEIVCPAWRHAAASQEAVRGVAPPSEHRDENQLGVSAGLIAGLKKTVFNSADFATIVMSSYAAAH